MGTSNSVVIGAEPDGAPPKSVITRIEKASKVEEELVQALEEAEEFDELDDNMVGELLEGGGVDHDTLLWDKQDQAGATMVGEAVFRPDLLLDDLFDNSDNENTERCAEAQERPSDAAFENVLEEYDDHEIGELSEPELDDNREETLVKCDDVAQEYIEEKQAEQALFRAVLEPLSGGVLDSEPRPLEKTKALFE